MSAAPAITTEEQTMLNQHTLEKLHSLRLTHGGTQRYRLDAAIGAENADRLQVANCQL